jgi:MFS family permease
MAVAEAVVGRRGGHAVTGLVALLATAIFINYIDRGNLATAAPLIKDEFRLNNFQIGVITSAFFWVYTPSQFLAAWLADRLNPYRALALGFAVWSLATALTGFAGGFGTLLALRLLLGLGESAAFPCMSKLFARHVAPSALGVVNGFMHAGLSFGPAVGTLAGGLLIAQLGWRAMFLLFGALALLWLWPWMLQARSAPAVVHHDEAASPPSFLQLLTIREMWGAITGHFASNYVLYFVLSWLPLYLVKERGFSIVQMAELGAIIYCISGCSSIAIGWLADRWVASGVTINAARKTGVVASHILTALCLAGIVAGNHVTVIACLLGCGVCLGANGASFWPISQTLAGPVAAARWVGLQNAIANCAGILAPLITGFIVDRTGSFADAFLVASVMAVVGVIGWGVIIRRVEPIRWARSA